MEQATVQQGHAGARPPVAGNRNSMRSRGRGLRATSRPAEKHSAAPLVGRPRLDAAIPLQIENTTFADRVAAPFALALLDFGILPTRFGGLDSALLLDACEAQFRRWLRRLVGPLHVFRFNFGCSWTFDQSENPRLHVEWGTYRTACPVVGPAFDYLASVDARLPGYVIQAIEHAGWNSIPVLDFSDQLGFANWLLWGGNEDENEAADEWGIDPEDREDFFADMVRRADIERATPARAFKFYANRFKSQLVAKRAINQYPDIPARAVADLAHRILQQPRIEWLRDFHANAGDDGGEFCGHGACLRWSRNDKTVAIFQALERYQFENGVGYDEAGSWSVGIDGTDDLRAFQTAITECMTNLRLLDELIWLLSAKEWN